MIRIRYMLALLLAATLSANLAAPSAAQAQDAAQIEAAAGKAIGYLKSIQNPDGTFGKTDGGKMVGVVGLAIHGMANSPQKLRETDPAVAKAAKYIAAQQQPNGGVYLPRFGMENYNTSVAVFALKSLENPAYDGLLEKAKQAVLGAQLDEEEGYDPQKHPRGFGGFGYGNSKRPDISNTAFSLEALEALGFDKNSQAYKNAVLFLKRCQDNDETNDYAEMKGGKNEGGFVYLPMDSEFGTYTTKDGRKLPKPYGNMTYMAVKSLLLAGVNKDDPSLQAAFKWIRNNYSVSENPGGVGTQGYFYYTNAMAQAFTAAGVTELELADGRKVNWAKDLAAHLISLQKPDGSFVNPDKRWMEDDVALSTAYGLRALNYCYAKLKQ